MKRQSVVLLGIALMFAAGTLLAQTTTYTVGGGMWMPGYAWVYTGDESGVEDYELGTGNYFGPYLAINHGRVNFGASMLIGTLTADDKEYVWEGLEAKRTDINLTMGYRLISSSALSGNVFIGLKYVKENSTADQWYYIGYDPYTYELYEWYDEYDVTTTGTLYGAGASLVIPFGTSNFYGYGSMAYLMGTLSTQNNLEGYSDWDTENDTHLFALTAGLGYRFPSGLGVNVGFRGDLFGNDESDDYEYAQRLSGLILNASYTF
jgi:hypothetical protein